MPPATPARGSVTVLVPTYGHARFIGRALTSLLEQSRPPDQIIVINDGSPDDTKTVMQPFLERVTYVEQEHQGVVAAANRGLKMCSTDYVMGFSSDDVLEPKAIEALASPLDRDPEIGLVHGGVRHIDANGDVIAGLKWVQFPIGKHRELRRLMLRSYIAGTACMFRRSALETSLPLLPPYPNHHDWAQWVAIGLSGWSFFGTGELITNYRRHSANASASVSHEASYRTLRALAGELRARYDGRLSAYDQQSLEMTQRLAERKLAWIAVFNGQTAQGRAAFETLWRDHSDVKAAIGLAGSYLPRSAWRVLSSVDRLIMRRSNVLGIWFKSRL